MTQYCRCNLLLVGLLVLLYFPDISKGQDVATTEMDIADKNDIQQIGHSKTKPKTGRFIAVDGGFMVPYRQQIPGTDITFEMVPVPGGTFIMGSQETDDLAREDEFPQVEIVVEPFWMGKYEVTWAEYKKFIRLESTFKSFSQYRFRLVQESTDDAVSVPSEIYDPAWVFEAGDGHNEPCALMTPFAAKQYTKYLSLLTETYYRLPTEAEWEYACRAGTKTRFYFGDSADELPDHAWLLDNSDDLRQAVGQKKPNPWGLHDMYGNVAEWVLDEYSSDYYSNLQDRDSVGQIYHAPTGRFPRVCRGGSFELEAEDCRSAARMFSSRDWSDEDPNFPISPWWHTSSPSTGVGFRLMRPLNPPDGQVKCERFWEPPGTVENDVKRRIDESGRGSLGRVSPKLFEIIDKFEKLRNKK